MTQAQKKKKKKMVQETESEFKNKNKNLLTNPGVRIGLQAGSSCCENLESAMNINKHINKEKHEKHESERMGL